MQIMEGEAAAAFLASLVWHFDGGKDKRCSLGRNLGETVCGGSFGQRRLTRGVLQVSILWIWDPGIAMKMCSNGYNGVLAHFG